MNTKNFVVTKEDSEIFETAVSFKEFFASTMFNKPDFITMDMWKEALKVTELLRLEKCGYSADEFSLILNDYDLFAVYDKTCVAIESFKKRGKFSKKFKKIFDRAVIGWYSYDAVKNHLGEIRYQTFHRFKLAKVTTEKQPSEFQRYVDAVKAKKRLIFTLGGILAVIWILFFLNHLAH